ncbi:hypothetical protein AVEN_72254-1 [Araneus ventricosus]|uniref:Uncharacterized protein n=1 Tax=Araneus ventricosus TaxID=182803 RepID=A0A4Y2GU27_ARAVE|nr:hypothetical protein AVEN_72254-1 [Araneus ventricosus]
MNSNTGRKGFFSGEEVTVKLVMILGRHVLRDDLNAKSMPKWGRGACNFRKLFEKAPNDTRVEICIIQRNLFEKAPNDMRFENFIITEETCAVKFLYKGHLVNHIKRPLRPDGIMSIL